MIKRRITILFLLVFSLGFTAQYKTVKGKNVKMSQQEMDRNAAEIVEILKFLDTDEVKQETIKAMKKDMKKTLEKEEGYIEKRVSEMMTDIAAITIENRETTVTKVMFLSDKSANVTIQIKIPMLLDKHNGVIEKDVQGEVDREYKKRYGELDFRILRNSPKSEQKKVMDRIAMIQKELIQKKIKNKTMKYEFLTENLMLVKINNEWKVKG
jgi:hypothetical protein